MLKSSLCNYNDAHILVKRIITTGDNLAIVAAAYNVNKEITPKNCTPFNDCISKIHKQYTNT